MPKQKNVPSATKCQDFERAFELVKAAAWAADEVLKLRDCVLSPGNLPVPSGDDFGVSVWELQKAVANASHLVTLLADALNMVADGTLGCAHLEAFDFAVELANATDAAFRRYTARVIDPNIVPNTDMIGPLTGADSTNWNSYNFAEVTHWLPQIVFHLKRFLRKDVELLVRRMEVEKVKAISPPSSLPVAPQKALGLTWQEVLPQAEALVQRTEFPGLNALAKRLGCHKTTLQKAIDNSPKLIAAVQRAAERTKAIPKRRRRQMNDALLDSLGTGKKVEDDADDFRADDLVQRLLSKAAPADRPALAAMPPDMLHEMARTLAVDPDAEFNFGSAKTVTGRDHAKRRRKH